MIGKDGGVLGACRVEVVIMDGGDEYLGQPYCLLFISRSIVVIGGVQHVSRRARKRHQINKRSPEANRMEQGRLQHRL